MEGSEFSGNLTAVGTRDLVMIRLIRRFVVADEVVIL